MATIGLLSGAWGHESEEAARVYFGQVEDLLIEHGDEVNHLTYDAPTLGQCTRQIIAQVEKCDIIIAYSMGGTVARMLVRQMPELKKKCWIGVAPVPSTGLSWRAFAWAAWICLAPFLRSFLPPWRVKLSAKHIAPLFFNDVPAERWRVDTYTLEHMHPERLLLVLQSSFPRLFRTRQSQIRWDALFVGEKDGFVSPGELEDQTDVGMIPPNAGHGWIMSSKAAEDICSRVDYLVVKNARRIDQGW